MSRRPPARHQSGISAVPLVAFLLVCSFGFLFVGCSRSGGSDALSEEDVTFTEEDIARLSELEASVDTSSSAGMMTGTGDAMLPRLDVNAPASGTVMSAGPVDLDLTMAEKYRVMRSPLRSGSDVYRVTNEILKVREQPNTTSRQLAVLANGDPLTVVDFPSAAWAKVKLVNGGDGYVASRYISKVVSEDQLQEEEKKYAGRYYVNFAYVNVRAAADAQSGKLGEIPAQEFVKPLSVDTEWARVPFQGKEGYVSLQYLAPFRPPFLVRQETFTLPILRYSMNDPTMLNTLVVHAERLKAEGAKILTMRDFYQLVLAQEQRDVRLSPKSVIIAVTDVSPKNLKSVSDALYQAGIRATFFLQSQHIGLSGITEKNLLTLLANGFDVQSAAHTGDDLRSLTNAQVKLELEQSRKLLEDMMDTAVFAVDYPQGGVNDRVLQLAEEAGYLFGIGNTPESVFTRSQFLRLPSYSISASMAGEDVVGIVK